MGYTSRRSVGGNYLSTMQGRVAVITGAGSGLGRALAKRFVESGAIVYGFGRTVASLSETHRQIDSSRFDFRCVDVADFARVKSACDEIVGLHGRIDFLFNNAAVYPRLSFLEETAAQWSDALAINVNGPANCCKAVLPAMLQAGFGRIFNVGSFADRGPIKASAAYSVSKGALHSLGASIQADIADLGVDVEVHEWIPGHLRTQMSGFTGIEPEISAQWAIAIASTPPLGGSRLFINDKLWVPPLGIRGRIKRLLTLGFLRPETA